MALAFQSGLFAMIKAVAAKLHFKNLILGMVFEHYISLTSQEVTACKSKPYTFKNTVFLSLLPLLPSCLFIYIGVNVLVYISMLPSPLQQVGRRKQKKAMVEVECGLCPFGGTATNETVVIRDVR